MNPRRLAFLLILVSAALLFRPSLPATSGDEWQPIDPADLKMTSEPKAPGAPAIYLYRQVDRKDTGRANTEYNYVRIKIFNEEGRKYANIEIPYQRERTSISGLRARTIHSDGSIVNFDGKTFDKMVYKTKTQKYLAKTFTMPDVQPGSIIEYHYNIDMEDNFIFNSHWILSEELFTRLANFSLKPYERWYLRWSWPVGLPAGAEPPKQDTGTPDHLVRMSAHDIPAFVEEDFMPPPDELKFRVDFVYSEGGFEENPDKFWKSYTKKKYDEVESYSDKRKAMEQAVSTIVSPGDNQEAKLRKIYTRCQQIRNLSYEPRKTGQEAKRELVVNKNVEDIWKNGYAYGWYVDWLFLGLARAAGFEAYPVIVSSRNEYFFRPNVMNSSELNANVVLVLLDGKERYFDPGNAYAPFGILPWFESGVPGRKLTRDGGVWVTTDFSSSSDSQIRRKAELKLSPEGALEGKVTVTYTGLQSLYIRWEGANQDDAARKKLLEDQLKENIPVAADIELKNQPEWNGSDAPFVADYAVKIDGWVSSAGRKAILPVGLFSVPEKHLFEHSDRTLPVYFRYYYSKDDDIFIELPPGWKTSSIPPAENKDAKAAVYTLNVADDKNLVRIHRTLHSNLYMVPKEKYPALRTFFQLVRTCDDEQIVLEPGAASANAN